MNCEICFNQYDHSVHKPYVLSCPHTFCVNCVNQLNANTCPTCNSEIKTKNPNLALLNFVPESLYDKLKLKSQKNLNEISEIKNAVKNKCLSKLIDYLYELLRKFIDLILSNETEQINELNEFALNIHAYLTLSEEELESIEIITKLKQLVENNTISEEGLASLVEESEAFKKNIIKLESEIEEVRENIEFTVHESVSMSDGLIGEIQTNKKVISLKLKQLYENIYF